MPIELIILAAPFLALLSSYQAFKYRKTIGSKYLWHLVFSILLSLVGAFLCIAALGEMTSVRGGALSGINPYIFVLLFLIGAMYCLITSIVILVKASKAKEFLASQIEFEA